MSLVSRTHQHGPQIQLAISASGGNCSRMHRDAPPLQFFWKRNFPLEFLGSEGTYVTLVVSRAQRSHFRGPYRAGGVGDDGAKGKGGPVHVLPPHLLAP